MQKFNFIYDFTVYKKVKKSVQKTQEIDGKELKIVTDEIVESPIKILFNKPGRRDEENGELFFARKMHEFVNKYGLMTRAMLANKYRDAGGLISEETTKELSKVYKRWIEISEQLPVLKATEKSKKDKEKIESLEIELVECQRQLVDLETYKSSLLDQTADTKAQNELVRWYVLNFIYIQAENEEPSPYFKGESFEEKLEDYFDKEESEDEIHEQVKNKIGTIVAIWFFHRLKDPQEFKKLVEEAEKIK